MADLEINFGIGKYRILIPLEELQNKNYIINKKETLFQLHYVLRQWLIENEQSNPKNYEKLIQSRKNQDKLQLKESLCTFNIDILKNLPKFLRNDPEINIDEVLKTNAPSQIAHWAKAQKNYFDVNGLNEMKKMMLYTCDYNSNLKQWNMEFNNMVKDYGTVVEHNRIFSMRISQDSKYLFLGAGCGILNIVNLLEVNKTRMHNLQNLDTYKNKEKTVEDYIIRMDTSHAGSIEAIVDTKDQKLFTADSKGVLIEWSINLKSKGNIQFDEKTEKDSFFLKKEKNYGKVLSGSIYSMALSNDNLFLILTDNYGSIRQYSINLGKFDKEYPIAHEKGIVATAITCDDAFLYTADSDGIIKKWSTKDRKLITNLEICNDKVNCMIVKKKNECLFVGGHFCTLKLFSIENDQLVLEIKVLNDINSILSLSSGLSPDSLLVGFDNGQLVNWSLSRKQITRDMGKITEGPLAFLQF